MKKDWVGYEIVESVFSPAECDRLAGLLKNIKTKRCRAGIRNLMSQPAIAEFANDPRLLRVTEQIAGFRLIPFKAILFEKTGKANWLVDWHQDTALPVENFVETKGWGPVSEKEGITFVHAPTEALSKLLALRIQLDSSTRSNGPLRVIPGSHRKRLRNDAEFRKWTESGPHVECTVGKGGVIAMSPLVVHASSKCVNNRESRRVLHIEYAPSLKIKPGVFLAVA